MLPFPITVFFMLSQSRKADYIGHDETKGRWHT